MVLLHEDPTGESDEGHRVDEPGDGSLPAHSNDRESDAVSAPMLDEIIDSYSRR